MCMKGVIEEIWDNTCHTARNVGPLPHTNTAPPRYHSNQLAADGTFWSYMNMFKKQVKICTKRLSPWQTKQTIWKLYH